jgi:hypothetical protein
MSDTNPGRPDRKPDPTVDTKSALQQELKRETAEGTGAVGDMAANRNLSGSSTWETLAVDGQAGEREVTRDAPMRADDPGAESRRKAQDEVADRLDRLGVRLTGQETPDELVTVLEAVERFGAAVEAGGGDLMMDEPVDTESPSEPDERAFVLPKRAAGESVGAFLERIASATDRAKNTRNRRV